MPRFRSEVRWSRERVQAPKVRCSFTLFAYYPSTTCDGSCWPSSFIYNPFHYIIVLIITFHVRPQSEGFIQPVLCEYRGYVLSFICPFPTNWFVPIGYLLARTMKNLSLYLSPLFLLNIPLVMVLLDDHYDHDVKYRFVRTGP